MFLTVTVVRMDGEVAARNVFLKSLIVLLMILRSSYSSNINSTQVQMCRICRCWSECVWGTLQALITLVASSDKRIMHRSDVRPSVCLSHLFHP